jgi:chromosome segregation ATPase
MSDGNFDGLSPEEPTELSDADERLAEAQAEVERLQSQTADAEARAAHLEEQNNALQRELEEAQGRVAALEEELAAARTEAEAKHELVLSLEGQVEELRGALTAAAERYRELLLASNPEVPGDLVRGESIEEVEASLEAARQTVLQVRSHLESQAQAGRVPTGSPVRSGPDLSALSPQEKIQMGLSRPR